MSGFLKVLAVACVVGLAGCATKNTGPAFDRNPAVSAPWKVGDEVEYKVTDLFTRTSRNVVYRVDRIENNRLVINQGARIEAPSGEVISIASTLAGDMDRLSPPGGWGRGSGSPVGMRWALRFTGPGSNDYAKSRLDLNATVLERSSIVTPAGKLDVVNFRYTGWVSFIRGSSSQVAQVRQLQVAYAPSLGRVVRFQSELQRSTSSTTDNVASKELVELVAVRRN